MSERQSQATVNSVATVKSVAGFSAEQKKRHYWRWRLWLENNFKASFSSKDIILRKQIVKSLVSPYYRPEMCKQSWAWPVYKKAKLQSGPQWLQRLARGLRVSKTGLSRGSKIDWRKTQKYNLRNSFMHWCPEICGCSDDSKWKWGKF